MCDLPLFKETRTSISLAFVGKAYLIGSIGPEDGFRIVSPGIRVFDYDEKSVVQLMIGICSLAAQPQRWGFFNESGASSTPTFSVEQAA